MKKIIIFYDIKEDKTRNMVSEQLKNYGLYRIGYSVFNGEIPQGKLGELEEKLKELIIEDKVHIVELCNACYRKIKLIGTAELAEENENEIF